MIGLNDYITLRTGVHIPFPNCETGQCMALMHDYLEQVFGLTDPAILATPSAFQVFSNFEHLVGNQYFTKIANTPTNFPSPGDLAIIGPNIGGAGADGHIFLVIKADINTVTGFSQNWPTGSPAEIRTFTYEGLSNTGWLTPKAQGEFISSTEMEKLVQESMAFESFVTSGYSTPNDVTSKIAGYESQITILKKQVGDLTTNNQDLELEVKHTKDQMAKLADITQQQATSDSTAIDQGLNAAEALKNITVDMNVVASDLGTTYPPVKNITGAIQNLQNQLKAAQIQLTKQAQLNKAKAQQTRQAVSTVSKGFFSWLRGLHGQIWE